MGAGSGLVREASLPYDVLRTADEVFITSSTRDVHPVAKVDDRTAVHRAGDRCAGRAVRRRGPAPTPTPEPADTTRSDPASAYSRRVEKEAAVTYASYLRIGDLLAQQQQRSGGDGQLAEHDELLFITIHQVYELWFKQLLHELRATRTLLARAAQGALERDDAFAALALLGRVLKISKTWSARSTCSRR